MTSHPKAPLFSSLSYLCDESDRDAKRDVTLPGQPGLKLLEKDRIRRFLQDELLAQDLERLAPRLWIMSTQSGGNINALHRQKIKGREIVITEDPRLHLVWIHDRIFIKPLPKYLLSCTFWELLSADEAPSSLAIEDRAAIYGAAMGFLRTYHYLIRHESDFVIAQREHCRLLPENTDWQNFSHFLEDIGKIKDSDVSDRYHYGEIRLSRLNLYAPLLMRKAFYEQVHGQYADHFARLYGPVLFLFAIVANMLNAMQVEVAVDQTPQSSWPALSSFFRWFSFISLFGTALLAASFLLLWTWMIVDEWVFAIRARLARRKTSRGQEGLMV